MKLEREVCALTGDPFRPEEFKAAFRRDHLEQVERLRRALPREILEQAADLRVLALDAATPEVIAAVTRWCEDNRRRAEAVMEAYQAWADEVRPLVGPEIQDGFAFHDSQVTAVERTEDRLTLFLEPGGYSEVRRADFLRPRVLEADEGLLALRGSPPGPGGQRVPLPALEGRAHPLPDGVRRGPASVGGVRGPGIFCAFLSFFIICPDFRIKFRICLWRPGAIWSMIKLIYHGLSLGKERTGP